MVETFTFDAPNSNSYKQLPPFLIGCGIKKTLYLLRTNWELGKEKKRPRPIHTGVNASTTMVFVQKSGMYDMPPDAIVLTPTEAEKYQLENFERLNKSVTWPVLYGRKVVAISVLLQSSYMLMRFRRRFRLGNYGLISSALPFCAAPTLTAAVFQDAVVTRNVILQNECSVCLHTRSALTLAFLTHIVSGGGGAMATLYYAHNKGNYTLPPRSWSGLLKFGKDVFNLNRRISNYHWMFLAFNILLSGTVIALQERATRQVTEILEQEDYELAKQSYLRSKQRRYNV